jgi:translation initiation factor 1A
VHFVDIIWRILKIGKRKILTESHIKELVSPHHTDLLGQVIKLIGEEHIIVECTDGKIRTCRKRKINPRIRIRNNELVLVAPWNFRSDRDDIIQRYIAAHVDKLEQDEDYLTDLRQSNNTVISR